MLLLSPRDSGEAPDHVTSLSLSCRPVLRGAQCQLRALGDGTTPPRDVTAWASWRVAGNAKVGRSPEGTMQVTGDGDAEVTTTYRSRTARVIVRLTPDRPAAFLATIRGVVYVSDGGNLRPLANARVEVIGEPPDKHTTTAGDGSYELSAVVPGSIVIRAAKTGFVSTALPAEVSAGDNRISLVVEVESPAGIDL